jgi:hypothetical protein
VRVEVLTHRFQFSLTNHPEEILTPFNEKYLYWSSPVVAMDRLLFSNKFFVVTFYRKTKGIPGSVPSD